MDHSTGTLILRRRFLDAETLAEHARRLSTEAGIDAYTARLKLMGQGPVSLRNGRPEELDTARRLVLRLGYDAFIAQESPPRQKPNVIRRFLPEPERLGLETRDGVFHLPRGATALLVIGDLSKRLTSKFTNRVQLNPTAPSAFPPQEQYKTILTAQPLLDLYLCDAAGRPSLTEPPLRIEPSKIVIEGAPDEQPLGTPQRVDRVVRLIKGYCGELHFDLDYGLTMLPGVTFEGAETPEALASNAESLAAYGWYLRQLLLMRVERGTRDAAVTGNETPAAVAVAPGAKAAAAPFSDSARFAPPAPLPPPPAAEDSSFGSIGGGLSIGTLPKTLLLPALFLPLFVLSLMLAGKGFPELFLILTYRGIAFALMAGACFLAGFRALSIKRLIENTPTAKVRSLAAGYVELHGTAERACNLISPVSGLACVFYRLRRYRRHHNSKGGDSWVLESESRSGNAPFYLRDETGRILIRPQGAMILPTLSETYLGGSTSPGLFGTLLGGGSDYKTIEELIPDLSPLCVLGTATPARQEESPWRRRLAERLKLLKQDRTRLMAYDADGNGVIDEAEWQTAVTATEAESAAELLKEQDGPKAENALVVEKPAAGELPFIISGKDESHTTRGFIWTLLFSFTAALVFLVAALWIFDYTGTHDLGSLVTSAIRR